jgi:hypothetical protein
MICQSPTALDARVSLGENIKLPARLETRTARDVLIGIRGGEWRPQVERLRALPVDSSAQRRAKTQLPFVVWAGEFSRRDSNSLLRHSGLVGVDLDGLDARSTRNVMHVALDDPHCAAAFRSARGEGVRLLIRVPPASAPQHNFLFDAASGHVQARYAIEPDPSGRDVSRASFVSDDDGLWWNPQAVALPVRLPETGAELTQRNIRCVNLSVPWWAWLSREYVPYRLKSDGTAFTHHALLRLGRRLALRLDRELGWPVVDDLVESAAREWWKEVGRRGLRLRGTRGDYTAELRDSVIGARKRSWFVGAAECWTKWRRESDFPAGAPKAAILFAIRHHCAETGQREFFLSCRDAASVASVSHVAAWNCLNELCAAGHLRRLKIRRPARHACSFRLMDKR